eukprot:TRINITY_DN80513_c0_g1_i1.p1 TRINITY_DN80513_c0_g1~~TRINITY_DN80513_c0_g1_i1.p1  ORF type:complete len:609 (-),score=153.97 TRINITY_DN80513_c0_g1_i1:104-1825(-)
MEEEEFKPLVPKRAGEQNVTSLSENFVFPSAPEQSPVSTTGSGGRNFSLLDEKQESSGADRYWFDMLLRAQDEEERKLFLVAGEKFELDSSYQPLKKLGFGSFGVVCSAYDMRPAVDLHARSVSSLSFRLESPASVRAASMSVGGGKPPPPTAVGVSFKPGGNSSDSDASPLSPRSVSSATNSPLLPGSARRKHSRKVAIKKISDIFRDPLEAKRVLRELKMMRHFGSHPNVMNILDMVPPRSISEFSDLYYVMEIMHSDLQKLIDGKVELSDEHVVWIVYQILRGVSYLHSGRVIHRDLKPGNILVNNDCSVKITDFGLARAMRPAAGKKQRNSRDEILQTSASLDEMVIEDAELDEEAKEELTEYVMTRWYRAPEVMVSARHYDYAVDIWSVGCILAELLNRKPLFKGENYVSQLEKIFKIIGTPEEKDYSVFTNVDALNHVQKMDKIDPVPWKDVCPSAPDLAIDLLSKMLVFNPAERITAADALNHPYFSKFRKGDKVLARKGVAEQFDPSFEKFLRTDVYLKDMFFEEMAKYRPTTFYKKPSLAKRYSTLGKGKRSRRKLTIHFTQSA